MANVTPGYTFTGTADPITSTKLNLLGQPTVSIGNDEVTSSMLASGLTLEDTTVTGGLEVADTGLTVTAGGATITAGGMTLGTGTGLFTAATTETFSGTIALTFGANKGNTRIIDCSSSTASTLNAASVPAAGYILIIRFKTDGTASNTITFGTNFKKTGTYALNSANHYYQIMFISDGTYLCEVCRSGGAS